MSLAACAGPLLGECGKTARETAQGVARVHGGRGGRHAGQLGCSVKQFGRGEIANRHLDILLLLLEN
jgi:hypothetical protein